MPALNHEPEEINEGFPEGIYSIRVRYVEFPFTFQSGNVGIKLQFDVWNSSGIGFTTQENVVTSLPSCKWKLKELCFALGIDYDNPELTSEEFESKEGKASMKREAGSKWLKIDHYLSVDAVDDKADNKVDEPTDDVPF